MPRAGSETRAEQLGDDRADRPRALRRPEVGRLLEELRGYEDSLPRESFEASLIRVTRRDWEKATRVPPSLDGRDAPERGARLRRLGRGARRLATSSLLAPHLETNLELKQRYVACFPPADETYDILLDDYEPEMKTAEVRAVFDELKVALIPLVRDAGTGERRRRCSSFRATGRSASRAACSTGSASTTHSWRLDETAHPFMSTPGHGDVRLTTRWEAGLNWLFGAIHEFGHGVYERDIDPALARTPLGSGVSLGPARVAEPHLGEPRRPQPPVLAVLLPAAPGGVSGALRLAVRGRLLRRHEPGRARR